MRIIPVIKPLLLFFLLLAVVSSACRLETVRQIEPQGPGAIYTAAAQTVVAQATLSAGQTAVAQLTQMAGGLPSETPVSDQPGDTSTPEQPTLTATAIIPSATPLPTFTPTLRPTNTPPPPPPPPPTPVPCDWAQFLMDVRVPDGTVFPPNTAFTKTWRLRNIGSCAWGPAYSLVFVSGERMGGVSALPLPGIVRPGEFIDLSVNLVAPGVPGRYRGYWMLSNAYGQSFGIGPVGNKAFWVEIQVQGVNPVYNLDFIAYMCSASWFSGTRNLPCPGDTTSPHGSVTSLSAPILETGKRENEPALWTRPNDAQNGWISGVYPPYRVQPGDRFMADIGCLENSKGCAVTFSLSYQAPGQGVKNLATWSEAYDGMLTRADVDLSFLAGQTVQFILGVSNDGKPARANAFWLVPAIRKGAPPPPPTPTPTQPVIQPAVQAAINAVSFGAGIPANQLTVHSVVPVQWPDSCLGYPAPGQICLPVVTPGYRILLGTGTRLFEAHTNLDGSAVIWFEI